MLHPLASALGSALLFAAKTPDELYKEKVQSARSWELFGYILVGLGVGVLIAGLVIAIVLDRKKKARKKGDK